MADRTSAGAAKKRKTTQRAQQEPGDVVLLSGGNPQIAKGYGDGPVQAISRRCRAGRARSDDASTR